MLRLALSAACIGFAPIFVRVIKMGPSLIGFYRCGFAALFLYAYRLGKRRVSWTSWTAEIWRLVIQAGALFALDLFVWHRSVLYAGAALGTLLAGTQVIYVALIGVIVHKERLTSRLTLAVLLALIGVALLVGRNLTPDGYPRYGCGVLFGLSTGIVYSGYILTMRRLEGIKKTIPTEHLLMMVSAVAAVFLLPLAHWEHDLRLPVGSEWALLIGLAFVAQVLGWMLLTRAFPTVPASQVGLILNMQPLVAVVSAAIILGERFNFSQLAGAFITLTAITISSPRKKPKTQSVT
ncbi:MAG: EamA family transporter [Deltaproteobacteria bacterium]|nr:EamA family transporter [Deltaproteobacteria bacterium]MBI3295210.1 EamA family transporter [Deltaproteobacteria bacterium]